MRSVLAYAIPCPRCGVKAGERCVNLFNGEVLSDTSGSHVNRTPVQPCGSCGGYQAHKKRGEVPCDRCREANRRYMQEYRNRNPEIRERDVAALRVWNEARQLLIDRHREEFDALRAELMEAAS